MESNVWYALLLTLFAGLSTGIGGFIAVFTKNNNQKFLSVALGFSAGVMIYISFVEILPVANHMLEPCFETKMGLWVTLFAFFGGMLLITIIDKLVPEYENPHEPPDHSAMDRIPPDADKLKKLGVVSAIAIAIHNFPEGIATFMSALQGVEIGLPIAVAVAIHNIPEGIAVAVPIFYATRSRKKAFKWSFLSGLAEPLGAIIAFLIIMPFLSPLLMGIVFASVAGIMIFISLDELLPAAETYGEHHLAIYGLLAGMAVMAVSLILL
ncbi:MAG: zinc transporter ZupT [Candidatus Delongbacteria bacterium]|nr:zinc transporter ZupT [Candidatus Delongbacteria bacterium]